MRSGNGRREPDASTSPANVISCHSANFVARELAYRMPGGWADGDRSTVAAYRPLETFGEKFEGLLDEIGRTGFAALDLWDAHLHFNWASPLHIALARRALAKRGLTVVSLGGWLGRRPEQFEAACILARALGVPLLAGGADLLPADRAAMIELLERYDLRFAYENHPEKTPAQTLALIGDDSPRIGTCVDTGWYATQGYDAARAIRELAARLMHVHLKDVLPGPAHEGCRYGRGALPVRSCVEALVEIDYRGAISVELEPPVRPEHWGDRDRFDARADIAANREMLVGWLSEMRAVSGGHT
jgi:L-ribulose-5-phosphate 3-epimerase